MAVGSLGERCCLECWWSGGRSGAVLVSLEILELHASPSSHWTELWMWFWCLCSGTWKCTCERKQTRDLNGFVKHCVRGKSNQHALRHNISTSAVKAFADSLADFYSLRETMCELINLNTAAPARWSSLLPHNVCWKPKAPEDFLDGFTLRHCRGLWDRLELLDRAMASEMDRPTSVEW